MYLMSGNKEKSRAAGLLGLLLVLSQPALGANEIRSADGGSWVRNLTPHAYADPFLEGDLYTGGYAVQPSAADVGKEADLFLVVKVGKRWYMHDGKAYVPWTEGRFDQLKPMLRKRLGSTEILPLLGEQVLYAADYSVYGGYRTTGGPFVYDPLPFRFTVQGSNSDGLLRFRSDAAMEAYLKSAMDSGSKQEPLQSGMPVTAFDSVSGATSRSSTTNLQVEGVDEADTVKLVDDTLFMLAGCEAGACLNAHRLDPASATSTALSSLTLDNAAQPDGMYLVDDPDSGSRSLVTLAGLNRFWAWFSIWGWSEGKTTLSFYDASQPADLTLQEQLKLDGALVASRRVGDTLYVVTRYSPALGDFRPYPVLREQEEANDAALEKATLPALLPTVTNADKESRPLIEATNCYLPASEVDRGSNPSIITISSISLQTRSVEHSACFMGDSETLYMTTSALYLATTSWDYGAVATDALVYSPEHSTTVHKFALADGGIVYRGSGEVEGHLGWEEDKKSFRMGENGDYLNVVTSVGDSWSGTSSTRLTVLKEAGGKLATVNSITGIGKPGEQLYAARFLGNRAYLVTFRLTDPLYVIDLSDQANPRIAGELEIPGYSDYLHPVSETLLLGIGKEAVAETVTGESGEPRGAWYQGVKLALFDVSNPAAPREIDGAVLGKRGTDSDVLWDHHAFTWLPPQGEEPARIAIPVRLHDRTPAWKEWDANDPSAWYDYTHTALYTFEVGALGITPTGRVIAQEAREDTGGKVSDDIIGIMPERLFAPMGAWYGDRSVLADDAVYYLNEGRVLGAFWGQDRNYAE
jgi:uncharacterized secreted protein with C-terminal beta-propeller domain